MISFLRAIAYVIGQIVSIIVYLPVSLVSRLFPAPQGVRLVSGWARFNLWWLRMTCGLTHNVSGLENVPVEPCVILAKHQSAWETIAFQTMLPPLAFVIKRELLWIPFFGWGLAAAHAIAIDRSKARRALDAVLRLGTDRLDRGLSVCIFPEGTRMAPGERGKYNPGGAMLATRSGADVIPIAHNAGYYWGRNGLRKRPGCIQVAIGPAIKTAGRKARDVNAEAEQWIEARCAELAAEAKALDSGDAAPGSEDSPVYPS